MLVGERMSHPVISVAPDVPVMDALGIMRSDHIRRLPVVRHGELVGIVSEKDLLYAAPSQATSLSVWEIHSLLSKIKVSDVMAHEVHTIDIDCPLEEAARIMADKRVGGLPVMDAGKMVGIITDTDLLKVFLEMLGARDPGVRIHLLTPNRPGEIAKLSQAIFKEGGNIIALGTFTGDDPTNFNVTLKVAGVDEHRLKAVIEPLALKVKDIRSC
jgi:acetoin utilization protein AcuB